MTGRRGMAGRRPPQEIADHTHSLWVQYATDGTLPWPEFRTHDRSVYQLSGQRVLDEPLMPAATFTPPPAITSPGAVRR